MRYSFAKSLVSAVLLLSYLVLPKFGFPDGGIAGHLLHPLSHANVWHLLANILCLWMLSCDLHLSVSLIVSVVCSFIPCLISEPTMGFSGVLFAMVGISWGKVGMFREMLWRNKWFLIIPAFIPHVNALIHLYCFVTGYAAGRYVIDKKNKSDWI